MPGRGLLSFPCISDNNKHAVAPRACHRQLDGRYIASTYFLECHDQHLKLLCVSDTLKDDV